MASIFSDFTHIVKIHDGSTKSEQPEAPSGVEHEEESTSSLPKETISDPHGDRRILVGAPDSPEIFTVSSHAMSLACKPWRAMLGVGGNFVEASDAQTAPIPFPEDDVQALTVLLNAAHLRFMDIPATMDLEGLYNLTLLCDKYDAAQIVQPWLNHWFVQVRAQSKHSAYPAEWLFISWAFGDNETFKTVTGFLLEQSKRVGLRTYSINGKKFTDARMPPMVFENIAMARNAAIDEILKTCYTTGSVLVPGNEGVCRAGPTRRETAAGRRKPCDSLLLGSLMRGLAELKLWPDRKDSISFTGCLKDLIDGIKNMDIYYYPHFPSHYGDCRRTLPEVKITLTQCCDTAYTTACAKLLSAHEIHIKAQEQKCRLLPCPKQ